MTLQVRRGGVFVPTDGWTPPAEWLPLPATTPGTPAFHGLVAVSPAYHWATVYAEGDFTVDWGDGRVEDFDSTTLATHTYDYASLPGDPFRGYRQAVVSVTPQAGQQLTSLDLAQGHPDVNPVGLTGEYALTPWLDIRIEGPDLTFISTDNLGYYYVTMLERAIIGDLPALVVGDEMFAYSNALRYLKIGAMPALTSFYYLVGSSYALNYLELGELPLTVGSGFDAPTDLSNCWFDREGVLGLFYSLGTVSDSPTITLSSHPDNANLTPDDLAIATDKGWVIAFP